MLGDYNQPEEHRLTQEVLTPCRDFTKRRAYRRLRAINTRGGAKIEARDTKENVTSQDRQATFILVKTRECANIALQTSTPSMLVTTTYGSLV